MAAHYVQAKTFGLLIQVLAAIKEFLKSLKNLLLHKFFENSMEFLNR